MLYFCTFIVSIVQFSSIYKHLDNFISTDPFHPELDNLQLERCRTLYLSRYEFFSVDSLLLMD
jgi:hypothetical protein